MAFPLPSPPLPSPSRHARRRQRERGRAQRRLRSAPLSLRSASAWRGRRWLSVKPGGSRQGLGVMGEMASAGRGGEGDGASCPAPEALRGRLRGARSGVARPPSRQNVLKPKGLSRCLWGFLHSVLLHAPEACFGSVLRPQRAGTCAPWARLVPLPALWESSRAALRPGLTLLLLIFY